MNRILAVLTFFLISLGLSISWFRAGLIYGGGDVGLQTYDPLRILEIVRYIWWEATAPGAPTPQGLTAIPFNLMFSLLKLSGFTPLMLQQTLFFLILFFMGWGMYLLILFLFGQSYRKYAILGGLFYVINPYMMVQVWHRFVHSTFFLAAALPFLVIFWMKWIRNKEPASLLIFLLINLLALYAFGTMAYIITLWLLLFLITAAETVFPWSGLKNLKKAALLFFIGFLLWFLTNSWWIAPVFNVAPAFLSEQHSSEQVLSTLYTLGAQTVLPYTLQMVNPFYVFYQLDFGSSYQHVFLRSVPWIFVAIIFVGLLRGIFDLKIAKWSVIYLVVLIFSKGAAPPLGYFYAFFMKNFLPLGVLRNPFEKIGVLLPLVSTILLVAGTKIIFDFLKKRANSAAASFVLLAAFILVFSFNLPFFTGEIFGRFDRPAFVEVPDYYKEADSWIRSEDGKILHLPLTVGESITYNWKYGYSGLEPSALLFSGAPSISHGFNLRQVDDAMTALYRVFHQSPPAPAVILRLLQDFNIKFIVLHKDVKWEGGEFYNPEQTEAVLNSLEYLQAPEKFGGLAVYRVADNFFKSKISFADSFSLIDPPRSYSLAPWILSEGKALITGPDNLPADTLIFPGVAFSYTEASASSTIAFINRLVSDQNYDNVLLAPLLKLKTVYRTNNEIQGEEINDKFIAATKQILKIVRSPSGIDLADYIDLMKQIFSSNSAVLKYYAKDRTISNIFQVHLYMLKAIDKKEAGDILKDNLIKHNFISSTLSEGRPSDLPEKTVLKFKIPKEADYELLLTSPDAKDLYENKYREITAIIDGKTGYLNSQKTGNVISLGQIFLAEGSREIDLPVLYSDNLVSGNNEIAGAAGGDVYRIGFGAKIDKGNGFYIQLLQDTDIAEVNGRRNFSVNQFIDQIPEQGRTDYQFPLPALRPATKEASVRFLSAPGDSFSIGNLEIRKMFGGDIFLRKPGSPSAETAALNTVSAERQNPVLTVGKFHVEKPAFVIFSESYHPGWKLILTDNRGGNTQPAHYLANLYANAWYIEKPGDYNFKLQFEPQKVVNYGFAAAIISYGGLVLYSLLRRKNEKN